MRLPARLRLEESPRRRRPYARLGVDEILGGKGWAISSSTAISSRAARPRASTSTAFPALKLLWEKFRAAYKPGRRARPTIPIRPTWPIPRTSRSSPGTRSPGLQVWSRHMGYPGDGAYLEFHKKHFPGGMRYWRITSSDADLGLKEPYDPAAVPENGSRSTPPTSSPSSKPPSRAGTSGTVVGALRHGALRPLVVRRPGVALPRPQEARSEPGRARDRGRRARTGSRPARSSPSPRARGARAASTGSGSTTTPPGSGRRSTASRRPPPRSSRASDGLDQRLLKQFYPGKVPARELRLALPHLDLVGPGLRREPGRRALREGPDPGRLARGRTRAQPGRGGAPPRLRRRRPTVRRGRAARWKSYLRKP